jgi:cytochrome o ubiquinol oxidase subunit 2
MTFNAYAMDQAGFDAWVQKVRQSNQVLDTQTYAQLAKPTENVAPAYYGTVTGDIFDDQIASFVGSAPSMKTMKGNGDQASAKASGGMNMSGM